MDYPLACWVTHAMILMQVQWTGSSQECQSPVNESAEGLAASAHQESIPKQSREADVGADDEDVSDTGVDVVCQRQTPTQEGQQGL